MQSFFDNFQEKINRNRDPDLGAHGVLAGAIEGFDAQMLFDPFEEQFDLPAAVIELRNGKGGQGEVVGQKDQRLARLRIA
jgi:hypothetical protein